MTPPRAGSRWPVSARTAVPPRAIIAARGTASMSMTSRLWQALIARTVGFVGLGWQATLFVMKPSASDRPTSARASHKRSPARPTNGRPWSISVAPGASPTITMRLTGLPRVPIAGPNSRYGHPEQWSMVGTDPAYRAVGGAYGLGSACVIRDQRTARVSPRGFRAAHTSVAPRSTPTPAPTTRRSGRPGGGSALRPPIRRPSAPRSA
jgi:hypothetical protein